MNSLTYTTIATLPQQNISNLTQLQWSVENWQTTLGNAACATSDAYRLFDEAIDRGMDAEERAAMEQLLDICELAQSEAYRELDTAKAILLERWN